MRSYGGTRYERASQRELRGRRLRVLSYIGLGVLVVMTAVVVVLALRR